MLNFVDLSTFSSAQAPFQFILYDSIFSLSFAVADDDEADFWLQGRRSAQFRLKGRQIFYLSPGRPLHGISFFTKFYVKIARLGEFGVAQIPLKFTRTKRLIAGKKKENINSLLLLAFRFLLQSTQFKFCEDRFLLVLYSVWQRFDSKVSFSHPTSRRWDHVTEPLSFHVNPID